MKDSMFGILESQKRLIRPAESALKIADSVIAGINSLLKKARLDAECVAGGSYAKGVILRDDFDVDLFVRFNYSYCEKDISGLLAKAISSLKPELVHGSRDYFQITRKGVLFEIIPVLKIDNYKSAVNVTDMSPLHVGYAKKHFDNNPGLRDEVRLVKQFCKGIGVYGAESYIRGFSGHVLDLLIIYYGSFEKLLMQASLWGERVVIDIEKHWSDPLRQLNTSKTISPLVIVDPIQPDRNAAAAVSAQKFSDFRKKAREFLRAPSPDFFIVKKLDLKAIRRSVGRSILIVLKAKPLKGNNDVVGTKLLKCHEFFLRELKSHDFSVLDSGWEFASTSTFYYVVKRERLSSILLLRGPPASDKANSDAFRSRHRRVIIKSGTLFAQEKRPFTNPVALLRGSLGSKYVREKVAFLRMA